MQYRERIPFVLDVVDKKPNILLRSVEGVALRYNGSFHGFAIWRSRKDDLVLLRLKKPDIHQNVVAISMKSSHNSQMKLATDQYRITVFKQSLKEVCVNATYNPQTIGLDISIGIDGHYITQEISVRNPPPICFAIPYMHEIIGVCLAFTKLDISKVKHDLSGCVELEAEFLHMRLCRVHLGCFLMPI
uniref:DUF4773 domain-containing protein n=1 Tax=Angiostrongylus cantonensis TaxID=6313 RepID=A0A0K0DRK9_ANGCA